MGAQTPLDIGSRSLQITPVPVVRRGRRAGHVLRLQCRTTATASPRIAVVGGGVMGIASAVRLQRRLPPGASVTIIAPKIGADTTSEGAAGLWKPYAISGTPPERCVHTQRVRCSSTASQPGVHPHRARVP
jgi:hypothetical protein